MVGSRRCASAAARHLVDTDAPLHAFAFKVDLFLDETRWGRVAFYKEIPLRQVKDFMGNYPRWVKGAEGEAERRMGGGGKGGRKGGSKRIGGSRRDSE